MISAKMFAYLMIRMNKMLWFKIVLSIYFGYCMLYSVYASYHVKPADARGTAGTHVLIAIMNAFFLTGMWLFIK